MVYEDRVEAGKLLARELKEYRGRDAIVLGVPRGGVVVAYEVARELGIPLDVVVSRKLPAPGNPELAIGAVAADGTRVVDPMATRYPGVSEEYLERAAREQVQEIERRLKAYRGDRPPLNVAGKTAIVVDDGIATGSTVLASLRSLRQQQPAALVLAVPVAPPASVARLQPEADRIIVLEMPEPFFAVGQWYQRFDQVSDEEVVALLERAHQQTPMAAG
ncbi:MAG: phosphoribosyltransferase [Armatimonadetes bacterium]|jgi:putative phosphoribosyl transferase|nr:phosphoribosyltransferase [Armatimonadota bacterium]